MPVIARKPLVTGVALLSLGAAAAVFWPRPAADVTAPVPAPAPADLPAAGLPQAAVANAPDLPWMNAPAAAPLPAPGQAALTRAQAGLSASRAQHQQMVANIDRQASNNLQALDQLEKQFEQLQNSGQVPAGVDVQKVRQNLRLVRRTQELSQELGNIVIREPSAEKTARMRQIGDELLMLQTQMQLLNPAQFAAKP